MTSQTQPVTPASDRSPPRSATTWRATGPGSPTGAATVLDHVQLVEPARGRRSSRPHGPPEPGRPHLHSATTPAGRAVSCAARRGDHHQHLRRGGQLTRQTGTGAEATTPDRASATTTAGRLPASRRRGGTNTFSLRRPGPAVSIPARRATRRSATTRTAGWPPGRTRPGPPATAMTPPAVRDRGQRGTGVRLSVGTTTCPRSRRSPTAAPATSASLAYDPLHRLNSDALTTPRHPLAIDHLRLRPQRQRDVQGDHRLRRVARTPTRTTSPTG